MAPRAQRSLLATMLYQSDAVKAALARVRGPTLSEQRAMQQQAEQQQQREGGGAERHPKANGRAAAGRTDAHTGRGHEPDGQTRRD